MQLVIDIPESIYDTIQSDEMISREQLAVLQMHILNGTPLPKGHGRLIDESKITKCEQIGLVIKDDSVTRCLITDAPTIIEKG